MSAIVVEPNPVQFEQPTLPHAEPCVVVIFGATGDLTKRKLMPALFARFSSRGEADFANKVLSAMRKQFGGHVEKSHK